MPESGSDKSTTETATPAATPKDVADSQKGRDDENRAGGPKAVLADLKAERDARKALEGQVSQMREAFTQALGIKGGDKADVETLLGQFQSRLDSMQHDSLVERVARQNGITDDGDLDFLRSAKDEEQMNRLADRLKAAEQSTSGTPKPDRTQGPQGSDNKPDPGPGVPRLAQAFEDALNQ